MDVQSVLRGLRFIRAKNNVTVETLAKSLRCDEKVYSQKESGLLPISTEEWIIIAQRLDFPLGLLLTDIPSNLVDDYFSLVQGFKALKQKERTTLIVTLQVLLSAQCAQTKCKPKVNKTSAVGNVIYLDSSNGTV